MGTLQGKGAVIKGGSTRIGFATAQLFVVASDLEEQPCGHALSAFIMHRWASSTPRQISLIGPSWSPGSTEVKNE